MEQIFSLAQKTSWRIEMKTLRPWRKSTLQACTIVCSGNFSSSYSFVQMPFRWSLSSTGGDSWWRRVKVSPTPHNVWRRREKEKKVGKKGSSKEFFTKWAAMGLTTRLKLCRWTFWSKVLDEWNPRFLGGHLWPCIENSFKPINSNADPKNWKHWQKPDLRWAEKGLSWSRSKMVQEGWGRRLFTKTFHRRQVLINIIVEVAWQGHLWMRTGGAQTCEEKWHWVAF